jgi:2-amino-4-hydroxy-6-hydroxymethyldihydropteridine diphosphokinase
MTDDNKLAFIALGGNLGQPRNTFVQACALLEQRVGTIIKKSSIYTTRALLPPGSSVAQPDYLNAVVSINTSFSPVDILRACNDIEGELGRVRAQNAKWGPRIIDLDLLAVDELVLDVHGLTLPHPELHLRDFALEPLLEIAPNWRHPVLNEYASKLLEELKSTSNVHIKAKESFNESSVPT